MINIRLFVSQKHENQRGKHGPDLLCGRYHSKSNSKLILIFWAKKRFTFEHLMLNEQRVTSFIKFLQRIPVRNLKNLSKNCKLSSFTPIFGTFSLNCHYFWPSCWILENFISLDHKFTPESVKKIRLAIRLSVLKIFEKQKGGVFYCHTLYNYIFFQGDFSNVRTQLLTQQLGMV